MRSRRLANLTIILFLSIQIGLFLRAVLPIPPPWGGKWPWSMFDRRGKWERKLEALGTSPSGAPRPIPLQEFFQYSRGFTPLHIYDHLPGLDDATSDAFRKEFAQLLARRMEERGTPVISVELRWRRRNLDTEKVSYRSLGTFPTGSTP